MHDVGPLILAMSTGAIAAGADLLTAEYNTTMWFVLRKSAAFYLYTLIYGAISGLAFMIFPHFVSLRMVDAQMPGSPWIWAILTGIFTRSLLQLNLFSIGTGPTTMKVGLRSLVNLFEPKLLRDILLDEFNAVRAFVTTRVDTHTDLTSVKERIEQAIPDTLPEPEKQAFLRELAQPTTVTEAMEKFLRFVGRGDFVLTFPLASKQVEKTIQSA
jgi:hypothetical protein